MFEEGDRDGRSVGVADDGALVRAVVGAAGDAEEAQVGPVDALLDRVQRQAARKDDLAQSRQRLGCRAVHRRAHHAALLLRRR